MTITELKSEAKARGVRWVDVKSVYAELRSQEAIERDYDREIRQAVWRQYMYTANCGDFWRHGMQVRFPVAFGDGDRTMIPNFDVVAHNVAESFPQFSTEDPAETLFDYIASEYVRQQPAPKLYREALEAVSLTKAESVPF